MSRTAEILGSEADDLLRHQCETVPAGDVAAPDPRYLERVWQSTDRPVAVLNSLARLHGHGRLAGTGYLSLLPVDQGVERSAGAMFTANPIYYDPENVVRLAIEGGCSGVSTTFGVLGSVARRYAHRIPFILKFNHNELLSYPTGFDQVPFAPVRNAADLGCAAVAATVYWGSRESHRQLGEVRDGFALAHELGMATILYCYLLPDGVTFVRDGVDHVFSADLTGQANHLGVSLGADFVKQKQPTHNGGYQAMNEGAGPYGKFDERMYTALATDHPIDLTRYQVLNAYRGRIGVINSGGESGHDDLREAVRTAVINKRAGGMGLIAGRKAFQKPMNEGVALLNAIQDVYLDGEIGLA